MNQVTKTQKTQETTITNNNKVSGKIKDEILSVISNQLSLGDDVLQELTQSLQEKNLISGGGRTSNSLIITDNEGNEFYPTFSWKPKVVGTKLGDKSPQMVQFVEEFSVLKTTFKKEVK